MNSPDRINAKSVLVCNYKIVTTTLISFLLLFFLCWSLGLRYPRISSLMRYRWSKLIYFVTVAVSMLSAVVYFLFSWRMNYALQWIHRHRSSSVSGYSSQRLDLPASYAWWTLLYFHSLRIQLRNMTNN